MKRIQPLVIWQSVTLCISFVCVPIVRRSVCCSARSTLSERVRGTMESQVDVNSLHQQAQREHFAQFILQRNWKFCEGYWSRVIKHGSDALPSYVIGDANTGYNPNAFGMTNLAVIRDAGMKGEFISKNPRYHVRQTFALCVGYDGNRYHGYQQQSAKNDCPGLTVEGDIRVALGRNTQGAGRTDRGVSAVSQVICFATPDMTMKAEDVLRSFRESEACREGRLAAYDCQRVPKKFHSRASATWRRYLYMFPLNRQRRNAVAETGIEGAYSGAGTAGAGATDDGYDVDVEVLNRILGRLEGKELPYNAYAYRLDRNAGQGLMDRCILYRARATVVNLADCAPGKPWSPPPPPILVPALLKKRKRESGEADGDTDQRGDGVVGHEEEGACVGEPENGVECNTQQLSAGAPGSRQAARDDEGDDDAADEDFTLSRPGTGDAGSSSGSGGAEAEADVLLPDGAEVPALCIELVGNRFLRRMVRILVATAIREAVTAPELRNENRLVEICLSGDRDNASRPLPGPPLCLAGVGYDHHDLAIYKFMPKAEQQVRAAECAADKLKWGAARAGASSGIAEAMGNCAY